MLSRSSVWPALWFTWPRSPTPTPKVRKRAHCCSFSSLQMKCGHALSFSPPASFQPWARCLAAPGESPAGAGRATSLQFSKLSLQQLHGWGRGQTAALLTFPAGGHLWRPYEGQQDSPVRGGVYKQRPELGEPSVTVVSSSVSSF